MKRTIQTIKSNSTPINGTNIIRCSNFMSQSSFKSLPTFTNTNSAKILTTNPIGAGNDTTIEKLAKNHGNNTQIHSRNTLAQSTAPINTEYHTNKLNSIKYSPDIQRNEAIAISKVHKRRHRCMCKSKSKYIRNGLFKHLDNQDFQTFKLIKRTNSVPMAYPVQNPALVTGSFKSKHSSSVNLTSNQKSYLDSQIWKSLRDSPHTQLFYLYGPDAKNLPLWQAEQSLEPSKLSDGGFVLSIPEYKDKIDPSTKNSFVSHQCHTNSTLSRLKKMLMLGLKVIRDGTWNTRMSITDFHRLLYLIEHPVFNPSTNAFSKLRYRMACMTKDHRNEIQDWIDREGIAAAVPENVLWLNPIKRYLRNHWKDLIRSIHCDSNNSRLQIK